MIIYKQISLRMENSWNGQIQAALLTSPGLTDQYCFLQQSYQVTNSSVYKVKSKKKDLIIALKVGNNAVKKNRLTLSEQAQLLTKLQKKAGIPSIYKFLSLYGIELLEMEWLEEGIEKINYSLPELTELVIKMLDALETLHNANYLYQAITPESFRISKQKLFLVGLSSSKAIPIRKSQRHTSNFIGHPTFASIRAHNLFQLNKKDNLESVFYVIALLYYRRLPWSSVGNTEHKIDRIKALKINSRDSLFGQMGFPFVRAFEYIMNLEIYSEPDYSYIKSLFKKHKTLIIAPSPSIQGRSKVKKISLNMQNKFHLPMSSSPQKVTSVHGISSYSFQAFSSNQKKCMKNLDGKQNFRQAEQAEENLKMMDCCQISNNLSIKFHRTISMKNPFL